ncbi:hypothetical protein MUK42_37553 [Musa troglodytarum]|uniref:Lactate/malate dehydrogenase N-terminal domain-containing protein n=1 Tax=Musa troglodytarum TaxID=320322 RepID=A0A9E7HDI8_9LILI|nr:hypothetical protein MUK42_37553 [Musa troglodytarum]
MLDLQHTAIFLLCTPILVSSDDTVMTNLDICIITISARQIQGEMRLNLLQRNRETEWETTMSPAG